MIEPESRSCERVMSMMTKGILVIFIVFYAAIALTYIGYQSQWPAFMPPKCGYHTQHPWPHEVGTKCPEDK